MDLHSLVKEIFTGIMYVGSEPTPLVNVVGQLASRIGFDDKRDSILTMAEVLAVICDTDVFDISKPHRNASLQISSNINLSQELQGFIDNSCYLPPLVCEPRELTHNASSAYYTHEVDSLILGGSFNHHELDICLDVLNRRNKVPLSLDVEFLCSVEEEPTFDLNKVSDKTLKKYNLKGRPLSDWEISDLVHKQRTIGNATKTSPITSIHLW